MSKAEMEAEADVRELLHRTTPHDFGDVDVVAVLAVGRRRRQIRRGVAVCAAVVVLAGSGLLLRPGDTSTAVPADPTPTALAPAENHAAWVTWADCLREVDIPGVTVTGPAAGSNDIDYRDEQGNALPKDFRDTNGEWGSATDFCAKRVPALAPQLTNQWGDLTEVSEREADYEAAYEQCLRDQGLTVPRSGPEQAAAEAAGCVHASFDPDAEKVLQCLDGQQSGLRSVVDHGPWLDTAKAAAQSWLARQSDRDEFATTIEEGTDPLKSRWFIMSRDGRTTGIVYLLVNTRKGWKLQGENVCIAPG